MADRKPKQGRTESLSLRLDPRTKFKLDFLGRLRGQSITTVIERAISREADESAFTRDLYEGEYSEVERKELVQWDQLWSMVEGERILSIAACPELFPTFLEEKALHFSKVHWPFFYAHNAGGSFTVFVSRYVEVLWPNIHSYMDHFDNNGSKNYWATGDLMAQHLQSAGLAPPTWPPSNAQSLDRRDTMDIGGEDDPFECD